MCGFLSSPISMIFFGLSCAIFLTSESSIAANASISSPLGRHSPRYVAVTSTFFVSPIVNRTAMNPPA